MGFIDSAVQILQDAQELKLKVSGEHDLLNDSNAWTDQQKLVKVYYKVLILDLEYALDKKVEQDLWNIGFKNYINILQDLIRDRKNHQRLDCQTLLNWCLEVASGFYITLLHEFCNAYDLDLKFIRYGKNYNISKKNDLILPQLSSCLYICQYCLVHLGDIARYRNQRKQAESFYQQAILVSPNSGHPYNQLALLEASLGDKLSTVFYYIRGIAVENPFPAASTNLLRTLRSVIDSERPVRKLQNKMTANEFIDLFLCTHAYLYTETELDKAVSNVKNLDMIMTALVATESFTQDRLIKMTVINLYALNHIASKEKLDPLIPNEFNFKEPVLDLLAGSLTAFLIPVHTLKVDEKLMSYYALPAVKIIFYWIQNYPHILNEGIFLKKLQIWPSLCKLLNSIQPFLKGFDYENYSLLPLPEDRNLKGFLPLSKYLKQFNFNKNEQDEKILRLVRIKRILNFGIWLTEHKCGTKLVTKSECDGYWEFKPGCIQPDPTDDLLEEIKSFNINMQAPVEIKKCGERKGGILKPQGSLEKSREEREFLIAAEKSASISLNNPKQKGAKMKRMKQNVALQSIFQKIEENKQVKFSVEEKFVKDEAKTASSSGISDRFLNTSSNINQLGLSVKPQPLNHNQSAFPSNSQDYLITLRNMANNYGVGTNYPLQNMYGGTQVGGVCGPTATNSTFNRINMDQPTFHQPQNTEFNSPYWWNNQENSMTRPGNYNDGFGEMMGRPKLGSNNQASGDCFNNPWNYDAMGDSSLDQGRNMSMRQRMLKEANNVTTDVDDKMQKNHSNIPSSYSLFNTHNWSPNLTNNLERTENAFGILQQSSLFADQNPHSLVQLLEQQNQIQK